ncbi:MAG: TonB-dependent receptor [Acidobacteriota bacterium]
MNLFSQRARAVLVISFLALLVAALPLSAQQTGRLSGEVSQAGSGLPGVRVTIASPSLQGTRNAETDVNGNYQFGALPPGQYTVSFEMEGMQTVTRSVNVTLAGTARADAEMKLSAVAEAITVTASSPAVAETQEMQANYSSELINQLPIGRTLIATVNLAPGVTQNGPSGATVISGAQSFDNVFYVDGAVVNEVLRGQPLDLFIEDALQETTVLTGAISAEYGRFTGGVVTAITKAGGNTFSGSLRDSLTNAAWTTTTPLNEPKADSKIDETYEATLGGRIIRDRLWFFVAGRDFSRDTPHFFANSTIPFTSGREQRRLEGKLTGQITPKHSVIGSYLDLKDKQTDNCSFTCFERSTLDASRQTPEKKRAFTYNGILTQNLLVEGAYSDSSLTFVDSGSSDPSVVTGTAVIEQVTGSFLGAPVFGSALGDKTRSSKDWTVKGTYYLSTAALGSHNIVAGYDDFTNSLKEDNSQSGSDFILYTYTLPGRAADGSALTSFSPGSDLIIYWPILQAAKKNDFNTKSFFVNDKWDLNNHLSFNLGARYDNNVGKDEAGNKVADDQTVSPRVGITYDVSGNGRLQLRGTYGQYVSKIANGNVGDAASPAGSPSLLYWVYYGPEIGPLPTTQAVAKVFDWFNSVGGINNKDFLLGGSTGGVGTQIQNKLTSPSVDEYTFGASTVLGQKGFLRADYQHRNWHDFYANIQDLNSPIVFDPLRGRNIQVTLTQNSDEFTRNYEAVLVQGGYRLFSRLNLGGNYTWSKLKGNIVGETSGSGPIPSTGLTSYQPELLAYAQRAPIGYLPQDQTHKVRLFGSYDIPSPVGNFNVSVLERFDSGSPYSVVGTIRVLRSASQCTTCRANPGYVSPTTTSTYYFGDRGGLRWDDVTATDLALNYQLPLWKVNLFVEGELINAFNQKAQVNGDTTVLTSVNSSCIQTQGPNAGKRCAGFDPFTETPVEGINYVKGSNFGHAVNPTSSLTAGDYQLPRTYRVSVGIRF